MNIKTTNSFDYLSISYENPYFVVKYSPMSGLDFTLVDCLMYLTKDDYISNKPYIYSFGSNISNDIIDNDEQVTDSVIDMLQEISPNTNFLKEN